MTDPSYISELPLNSDVRWVSIDVAAGWLIERLRDSDHAVRDLDDALVQGSLRAMVRSVDTGERKLVATAEWEAAMLQWWTRLGVMTVRRPPVEWHPTRPFQGWSLFIWLPDFEALWPRTGAPAPFDEKAADMPQNIVDARKYMATLLTLKGMKARCKEVCRIKHGIGPYVFDAQIWEFEFERRGMKKRVSPKRKRSKARPKRHSKS